MIRISIQSDIAAFSKSLNRLARQQIPFASATALNGLADRVRDAETQNFLSVFKRPSPFTVDSLRIIPALKNRPEATVFVMDKAAQYLHPYEAGGVHFLPAKGLLNPKNVRLNQYGQLSRTTLSNLLAKPDVFYGKVTFRKSGKAVRGIWQRPPAAGHQAGPRLRHGKSAKAAPPVRTGLKLLVRFGDALPVNKHLGYQERAKNIVQTYFAREMSNAIGLALKD